MSDDNKNIEPINPSEFNALNFISTSKELYDKVIKMGEYYLGITPDSNSKS